MKKKLVKKKIKKIRNTFCVRKIGPNEKKCHQQNRFISQFYSSVGKFGPHRLIGSRKSNFWRKYIFNFIYQIYQKSMANIENFVQYDQLGEKLKMFDIFPSFLWCHNAS